MAKPWLKMWAAWLHEASMVQLSLAERGAWWSLYTYAHLCDAEGKIVSSDGNPVDRKTLLDILHIKTVAETRVFDSMHQKMLEKGELHLNGDVLVVTNYQKQQSLAATDDPTDIKSRVSEFRARQRLARKVAQSMGIEFKDKVSEQDPRLRAEVNRLLAEGVTDVTFEGASPTPPSKKDTERETDIDIESNAVTGVTAGGNTGSEVTGSPLQTRGIRAKLPRDSRETSDLQKRSDSGTVTEFPLPPWVDKEAWDGYLEMRTKKKAVPTPRAVMLVMKTLAKLREEGHDPNEVLNQSTLSNWTGVFPLRGGSNGSRIPTHQAFSAAGTTDEKRRSGAAGADTSDAGLPDL